MEYLFKGHSLLQPSVSANGLVLYYDMVGKKNEDVYREKIMDLSGNSRNGSLENFAFTERSGYNKGLNFDGVDDKLKLAPLTLTPTSFTIQVNDVLLAYEGDTVRRVFKSTIVPEAVATSGLPKPETLTSLASLDGNILSDFSDELETTVRDVQTGNPVFSDKADEGAVVHVEVGGISKQETAPAGANLIDLPSTPTLFGNAALNGYGGTTGWTAISNGIKLTGMWNAVGWKIPLPVNTVVTFSADVAFKGGTADSELTVGVNVESGTTSYGDYYDLIPGTTRQVITFTTHATKGDNVLGFASNEAGAGSVEITNVQIELGAVNTPYAPVTPPMPSPTRPGAITSLDKSFDIVSSVGGRNLIKGSSNFVKAGGGSNGSISTITPFGEIKIVTTSNGNNLAHSFILENNIVEGHLKENDKFTISVMMKSLDAPSGTTSIYLKSGLGYFNLTGTLGKDYSTLFYTGIWKGDTTGLNIHLRLPVAGTYLVQSLKLEKGDLTPYSQAPEDIQPNTQPSTIYKTNIQLSEPLRNFGNTKDRVFLDTDGLWYVERKIYRYLLPQTGYTPYSTKQEVYSFSHNLPNNPKQDTISANFSISNRFLQVRRSSVSLSEEEGFFLGSANLLYISLRKINLSSKEASSFINWLENNPTEILYELEKPIIEVLPESEQQKLNSISTFKTSNYVYTVANLTPSLKATFKPIFWYKNRLVLNQVKFWNRPLTNEELLSEYKLSKERYNI